MAFRVCRVRIGQPHGELIIALRWELAAVSSVVDIESVRDEVCSILSELLRTVGPGAEVYRCLCYLLALTLKNASCRSHMLVMVCVMYWC